RLAQHRNIDDISHRIGTLVSGFKPDECANYLVNAGYASVKT
ncbi:MAG: IS630 family transposase, partial [Alphaproteobacteria bacterium]